LEARHQLNKEHGIKTDFMRVRALPFTAEVRKFVEKHDRIYVIDMNRDGQLHQLLTIEYPEFAVKLASVAHGDGMPASARWVREGILARAPKPAARLVKSSASSNGKKPARSAASKKKSTASKTAKPARKPASRSRK
jgi:hypothetical protein